MVTCQCSTFLLADGAQRGSNHLEPAQILDAFVRALNGLANGLLDGSGGVRR